MVRVRGVPMECAPYSGTPDTKEVTRGMVNRSDHSLFQRMIEAIWWTGRSLAEEVEKLDDGWCIRTPGLPNVWSLNHLALRSAPQPVAALSLADRLQNDLSYRHIHIAGADVLLDEGAFARAGWRVDREVYMVLHGTPTGQEAPGVRNLTPVEVTPLMAEWIEEDHPGIAPSIRGQIEEASRLEGQLWGEHAFGIVDDRETPVAVTKLRIGQGLAWVEDVFTSARARGRGHARRLVSHAARLAADSEADFAFIVADDNDWPKDLYSSVGFRPVARTWTLHREPTFR
jgi:GNAT superfamily N-acetyltransferase